MIRAARLVAGLFGLLLVVVFPIGALLSDRGVMTPTPKPTYQPVVPTYGGRSGVAADLSDPNPGVPSTVRNRTAPPVTTVVPENIPSTADDGIDMLAIVLGISQSIRDYATNCRSNGGVIRSGSGGDRLCSANNYTLSWPMISLCGMSPSDTKWTVFRGDTDTWDITITCAERPGCDGPSNALCTKNGCTFSESCLPK